MYHWDNTNAKSSNIICYTTEADIKKFCNEIEHEIEVHLYNYLFIIWYKRKSMIYLVFEVLQILGYFKRISYALNRKNIKFEAKSLLDKLIKKESKCLSNKRANQQIKL